ncbi:MAG: sulfite exporter TauE/SafE family protein [Pseudomonadota bacterium]
MLFPVSGVETHPLVPFLSGLAVSFFTSMGGVSGAFLLLPFQMSVLGYTAPSVSATNQVFNIVAIPSGVYRYIREGRMLWPLTWAVIIGTLPGVFIGAWVRVRFLPDPKAFKCFVGAVMMYIGWRLTADILNAWRSTRGGLPKQAAGDASVKILESTMQSVRFTYAGAEYRFSPVAVYALCFLVGIAGGIYGIGGGSIVAPFFVAIIGLPVYTVAGAALMGTFVTSVAGVVFFHLLALAYPAQSIAPDWWLGSLFGLGGLIGMYAGARVQKHIPAWVIKIILCACVFFVAFKYILGFFQ